MDALLRQAITKLTSRHREQDLARSSAQLTERYRRGEPALRSKADVAAYVAVRMPATHAAITTALTQAATSLPRFKPVTQLDAGGGTGAASWAATAIWPSLRQVTLIERDKSMIAAGRELAAGHPVLSHATWRHAEIGPNTPHADLVTLSYVLGELPPSKSDRLVDDLAGHARVIAIVEPGTPDGYARVLAARTRLVERGLRVAAPCPHDGECPLAADWCHFSVRLPRTGLHRRLKEAERGFEDEKFSYVVATSEPVRPAAGRVLRHPRTRKGLVTLEVCADEVRSESVSRREGELYRAARKATWGAPWP